MTSRGTRTLLIDPFAGASGDMLLAALIDAGASIEALREALCAVDALRDLVLDTREVRRGAFRARQLAVQLPHEHVHRGLSDVTRIVEAAGHLDAGVRERTCSAFTRLAEVEARMHGTTVDEVHFHEVGALDAIMDVTGFFVAARLLGIEAFRYTHLQLGEGTAQSAHGTIPVPAPATLELLAGHPVRYSGRRGEQITPTAAAIIATVFRPLDSDETLVPGAFGYGAGTREDEDGLPGVLRVVVGECAQRARTLTVIRCTVDDMTPEVTAHATGVLFSEGALEVYVTPVSMKKNRPGIELTVLCTNRDADRLTAAVLTHTTTIGVRVAREERVELERETASVATALGNVDVKIVRLPDGSTRMSPEYESCRRLAESSGRPIEAIYRLVAAAWEARGADSPAE